VSIPQPGPSRPGASDTETGVDLTRRLAPGTLVGGRYRIQTIVGVGGMGVVYRARDEELGLDIALKVLKPHLGTDQQWIERFRRELVLARQVTHRNVVRIHDIGESDGLRFLTMRYVEGPSLHEVLEKGGPLPLERALRILRQLADALQDAHDAGIVHRDLKPANILLEADDTAYITDFGVARSLGRDAGLTRARDVVGTTDYLSPEQARGEAVDGRSDLYALGVVFFEMLTRELPSKGDTQAEVLAQRISGRVRDIAETGVHVPLHIQRVIRRCLERSPARRYQNARQLTADLDRPPTSTRLLATPRRLLAVSLLVLAAIAGWIVWRRAGGPPVLSPPASSAVPVPARHAVAVLPFADETADPALAWTGTGIAEMIAASLSESSDLRVLDTTRVLRTLRDLQLATGRYDESVLRRLAQLLEVDSLVAGSVRRAGATVRVDLRLVSIEPGGTLATRHLDAESAREDGLFRTMGGLGERLRHELGAGRPRTETAASGTSSLKAATSYRDARARMLLGDYIGAAPALETAVAADPGFAAALESLSETYESLGYHDKALAAAERAASAVKPAETRLQYRVTARLALLRGDPAGAEKSYAGLAERYPNDTEILLDLATAQGAQGEIARAVETLQKATALDRNDPRAWFLLGKNTIQMGDAARAVNDYLVRALALHNQLRNEQGQADVLNAMGVAYHQLGQYPPAIEKYAAAADMRRRLGDERGVATSLKNRARVYVAMGRFDQAEPDLREARRIHEKIGDRPGLANVLDDVGVLHEGRGDYAGARVSFEEALRIRRDLGDERQLAQSYDNLGYVLFMEGQYDNALVYWQQGLDRRRKIGEKGGIILSMQNMGFLQITQGRWAEALKTFMETLDLSREIDFKNAMAVSYGNLGVLHQYEGRYPAALTSFEEALAVLQQLDDKRGLAEFTLKQAAALLELGHLDAAKARLDAAEAWLRETGNREQSSDYHVLVGDWHGRRGEREAARAALDRGVEQATASKGRAAILRAHIARAAALEPGPAAPALQVAVKDADALGDALLRIRAAEAFARAELGRGRLGGAEESARQALRVAESCGWEAGLYRLHALLGRILEKKGEAAAAAAQYQESARRIARLREGLAADLRGSFAGLAAVREVEAWMSAHPAAREPSAGAARNGGTPNGS
jgi:tetratricopeptide (TPR) repeat protein/TolB-like protein